MGQSTPGGILLPHFSDASCPEKEEKAGEPAGAGGGLREDPSENRIQDLWPREAQDGGWAPKAGRPWGLAPPGVAQATGAAELPLSTSGHSGHIPLSVAQVQDTNRPASNHFFSGSQAGETCHGHQLAKERSGRHRRLRL